MVLDVARSNHHPVHRRFLSVVLPVRIPIRCHHLVHPRRTDGKIVPEAPGTEGATPQMETRCDLRTFAAVPQCIRRHLRGVDQLLLIHMGPWPHRALFWTRRDDSGLYPTGRRFHAVRFLRLLGPSLVS